MGPVVTGQPPTGLIAPSKDPSAHVGGRAAAGAELVTPRCHPSLRSQPEGTAGQFPRPPGKKKGALVFHLDGVLVNSLPAYAAAWTAWAATHHVSLTAVAVAVVAHGRRPRDVIRLVCPDMDLTAASEAFDDLLYGRGVSEVVAAPGAVALTRSLSGSAWAIATSGPRCQVERTLRRSGIAEPPILVCGDDLEWGTAGPQCLQLAANRLGCDSSACTAVEDSPAGIQAARSAGMACLALATTHRAADLAGADIVFATLLDAWDALVARCRSTVAGAERWT